ncbi:DUF4123 domain-containing protein [Pseudomonas sp. GD03944]|uniref:DUF4123 domain-containing protein n=1 Tax=Pseudomonas sp. GD03944 TaxID=2975409 RepID=UPI00244883F3|nr:DUF4123 domain-containing protein [Pseudomonas sp. GD03944]MDH1263448.1 DUF4123 domain-containing protein [Pseudomonas sp. GD03944]
MSEQPRQYLLLDGAQIDNLLAQLYQMEAAPALHRLYQGTLYDSLADTSPTLIELSPDSRLEAHFTEHWQAKAGVWLQSDTSTQELVEHLRSLVHASIQGVTVLLRYYDPRVMRHWLVELPSEERDHLMGPIQRIRLAPRNVGDEPIELQRQMSSPAARYDDVPWLHLSDDTVERLNKAHLETFDEQVLTHIDLYFPNCHTGQASAARQAWAQNCRLSANAHGYGSADQVVQWANLCAVLGVDFPQAPAHQPYRQILDTPQLNPQQRLERLALELQRQLLTDKEVTA